MSLSTGLKHVLEAMFPGSELMGSLGAFINVGNGTKVRSWN